MSTAAATITSGPQPAFEVGSMIRFDPSQKRFFLDEARVIVVNWHRQKGKDFVAAAKAVDQAMRTGQNWYLVSLTQRQADATFDKCKKVFSAFKAMFQEIYAGDAVEGAGWDFADFDREIGQLFVAKARELILPNGARIVSLPGKNPDTLAGLTGNVIFTEFGLFPNGGYDHWRVVFPLSTRGFSVIVISTPRGKNSKFFELWNDKETYSVHTCTIVQSVEQDGYVLRDNKGQPTSLESFKKLYGDDAGWRREYMCEFTGDLDALIKWAQILAAGELGRGMEFSFLKIEKGNGWVENFFKVQIPGGHRLEMGWDVARHGDVSSLWCNLSRGPQAPKSLRFLVLMMDCEFSLQRRVVMAAMDAQGRGSGVGCGDATGMGEDSNETLCTLYPELWQSVKFTVPAKSELGSTARTAYGDATQALPPQDGEFKFIGTDLYAIQCQDGGGQGKDKRILLAETANPLLAESHCDIAYSNFLALKAGSNPKGRMLPSPQEDKPEGW